MGEINTSTKYETPLAVGGNADLKITKFAGCYLNEIFFCNHNNVYSDFMFRWKKQIRERFF